MQAVGVSVRSTGLVGGHQALGDNLPAKNALLWHQAVADKGEGTGLARRDVLEHFGKAGFTGNSLLLCG
jgi:hypothetical protein